VQRAPYRMQAVTEFERHVGTANCGSITEAIQRAGEVYGSQYAGKKVEELTPSRS